MEERSNIAREGCVDAIADGFLDGRVVLLFVSGGCKDEHVKMWEESHQNRPVSLMVLQLVVETTMVRSLFGINSF